MKLHRWGSAIACLLATVAGVWGGISLALLSAQPAAACFDWDEVAIVTYRGDDTVPPQAEMTGWEAPMFYTTPTEGAYPAAPAGNRPTGLWAPGDTFQRSLVIRNVSSDARMQVDGIEVQLSDELALANWFRVTIRAASDRLLFDGTLSTMAAHLVGLPQDLTLNPGERKTLTFTVHLDISTDQRLQGRTVRAKVIIHSSPAGYTTGKVTGGSLRYDSGRKTGGFVINRRQQDEVPTGNLEYQDHRIGLNFHADQYTDLLISLDRTSSWFSGSGRLNGVNGYTFRARAYDLGEPGRNDEFEITIFDPAGNQVHNSGGVLGGGNIQIHRN